MTQGTPISPKGGGKRPPPGRTVALANVVPPDNSGRTMFLASCGVLILMMGGLAAACAFMNVFGSFAEKPMISFVSAFNAVVLAIPYFMVILWMDRNEKEPPHLIASAFLWGAIMSTMISCVVNTLFGAIAQGVIGDPAAAGQLTASISAPFIEELTKGAALWVIFLFFKKDFDNVMDGIVYGALVGLGFAAFENFMYYARTDTLLSTFVLTMMRGVIGSVGSHACYTALTGIGFGLFRVMRKGALRWAMPPLFLGLSMFTHFAWNTFVGFFFPSNYTPGGIIQELAMIITSMGSAVFILQLPFVVFVLIVTAVSLRHERKLIEQYLSTEVAPVLMPGELQRLVPARRRSWHSFKLLATFRLGEWFKTRKRNRKLIRLAFEKWHMDQEAKLDQKIQGHYHAERVLGLRKELADLA